MREPKKTTKRSIGGDKSIELGGGKKSKKVGSPERREKT